ncbi:hypothetical protein BDN70DRAFT_894757 [Pholiota conissans]|uniref:Uncharacterized protein n=1 Tax=Pholiota conissans TaxID=109636 RepID=A0A9P6CUJ0_9AGAR|nr:hypothetical protein BDN70DRAFT_894757 [Pholiota conissans]
MNNNISDYDGLLNLLNAPFAGANSLGYLGSRGNLSLSSAVSSTNNISLSVNYLPAKTSVSPVAPMGAGARSRKKRPVDVINIPKWGGGQDVFKSGEARMSEKRLRWNKFKWILFVTNTCSCLGGLVHYVHLLQSLIVYSLGALLIVLLTWFDVFPHSDVVRIANRPELILSTIAACIGLLTCLNLEGKINAQWSRTFNASERLLTCYARSILPGCKLPYLRFQRVVLQRWYMGVFAFVPAQLAVMIAGLLCSNHTTYWFGMGMMPEAYRLNMGTMAVIMENYANQLAEQYSLEVAADILKRSQSNLDLASPGGNSYGNSVLLMANAFWVGEPVGGGMDEEREGDFEFRFLSHRCMVSALAELKKGSWIGGPSGEGGAQAAARLCTGTQLEGPFFEELKRYLKTLTLADKIKRPAPNAIIRPYSWLEREKDGWICTICNDYASEVEERVKATAVKYRYVRQAMVALSAVYSGDVDNRPSWKELFKELDHRDIRGLT